MKENKAAVHPASREKSPDLFSPAKFVDDCLFELKGAPLSVLMAYKRNADKNGLAWPSLRTLAAKTGFGMNTVKMARRELIALGWLIPKKQARPAGRFGRKEFQVCTVAQKLAHGTVASFTVARSTVGQKQCQEGSPSEGIPVRRESSDAVRRPFDAEQRLSPKRGFSPSEKKKKLAANLGAKIREEGDSYLAHIEWCEKNGCKHPFGDEEREAFRALQFEPDLKSPTLSCDFVSAAVQVYDENRGRGLPPGILCSKVIDFCECQRKKDSGYYYSPDFIEHRNRLRAAERRREQDTRAPAEVRA